MSDFCTKVQQLGKGIGNPTRYKIIEVLTKGPKTVNDIVSRVGLTQPAVSQHLRTLKMCGLVESNKQGQEVYYSVNAEYMLRVMAQLTTGIEKCKHH